MNKERMRLFVCILFILGLVVVGAAAPEGRSMKKEENTRAFSVVFTDTELVTALEFLARQMNRKLQVDWEVEGKVTANLWGITPEAALIRVLAMQPGEYEYFFIDGDSPGLLVARRENLRKIKSTFGSVFPARLPDKLYLIEVSVEEASVDKVIVFLASEYENVMFAPHSGSSSFYALGGREDLLQVKRELAHGGVDMGAIVSTTFRIQKADPEELSRVLSSELPDLEIARKGQEILITGPHYRLSDLHRLIGYLDRPKLYLETWLYPKYISIPPEIDFSGERWRPLNN